MKRKTLLLSLLALLPLSTAWADVEINETNFPDENFRSYLMSFTYGSDGVLTDAEIQKVRNFVVSGRNIQSLKGIEYFTALKRLTCNSNRLTSLDVSKNTALTSLTCNGNQLTSLDVSGCAELTSLSCLSNRLTSLDVSQNVALTSLSCEVNQLASLDVSQNVALTTLRCHINQITSLDVSKNTELQYLQCYNNQLTSLCVSGCSALTELRCSWNQLTSLDVSGCTALTTLDCFRNQIQGAAMDALVQSLPQASDAEMYVINNENEQNVMTVAQVEAAKAKGWIPYYTNGEIDENGTVIWKEYAGSDPSDISSVNPDTDDSAVWYDLLGRRMSGKPSKKGLYVKDGKKILVK